MNLSKSRYCKALQCKKQLWMDVNMPDKKDEDLINEAVFP